MNNFEYQKVQSTADALEKYHDGAMYISGGTNLLDLWKYRVLQPDAMIDLGHGALSNEINILEGGGVMLGAAAKNADTAYHPYIEKNYPLLSDAILAGASAQIRNMASNGGNLLQKTRCYYYYDADLPCNKRQPGSGCPAKTGYNRMHAILGHSEECIAVFPSDMCVALAALDAMVHTESAEGKRIIPFHEFHRLPGDTPEKDNNLLEGEIITGIELPPNNFKKNYSYLKIRDRHSYAFALVSVAAGLEIEDGLIRNATIALGGVAHKPWRIPSAEKLLVGKTAKRKNFELAAEELLAGAVGFEHNTFKIELAKKAIVRNLEMALHPENKLPGAQPF